MRELSLFTGAGGGLLGTKLLGWTHVGYVEWNEYCQRVIAQRIADGYLDRAPIFTDVREFAQSGAADQYRGIADVVSAGFPCQPFSVAGKQAGADDERNMWPATVEVIRRVQPRSVLLENVPGLISCGYLGTVLADLAALGFVGRWGVLGACDAGAPHKRDRLWIVAHSMRDGCEADNRRGLVSNGDGFGSGAECGREFKQSRADGPSDVADADGTQREGMRGPIGVHAEHADPYGAGVRWWRTDPADVPGSGVGRVADRMAARLDERLAAIGNGQSPFAVALAWRTLQ